MSDILTTADVLHLATVLEAAQRSAKVRWLADDDITVLEGTARHIVAGSEPGEWHFIGSKQDVRDSFLRITTTTGWDRAVPVRRLMKLVAEGGFAIDS